MEVLGLDFSHFSGQRRWTDQALENAITASSSWTEVIDALGLAGGSSASALKGHALRLGIETEHLQRRQTAPTTSLDPKADLVHLRRAGSLLAAAWFTLCGHDVSWPLEPCRYDLLVRTDSGMDRIQVKTTTVRTGLSWTVWLSTAHAQRVTYDPDEVDYFFVIDGDLSYYLIPIAAVGGLHAIKLSAYAMYRISDVAQR